MADLPKPEDFGLKLAPAAAPPTPVSPAPLPTADAGNLPKPEDFGLKTTVGGLPAAVANPADTGMLDAAIQMGKQGTRRFVDNVMAGTLKDYSQMDQTGANLFMILDSGSKWLSDKTGIPRVDAFMKLSDHMKDYSADLLKRAQAVSPGDTPLDEFVQTLGAVPGAMVRYGGALALGGLPGVFALGALEHAHEGVKAAAIGGAANAALGSVFRVTEPLTPLPRAAVTGTAAGTLTAAQGGSPKDVLLSTLSQSALSMFPASKRPQAYKGVAPEAIPEAEPAGEAPTVEVKPEAGAPPELVKTVTPAVVVTPGAEPSMFLGRDYSQVTPPDRTVSLNLRRIEGPDDLKAAMADFVEAIRPMIDDAKRGTITLTQTQQMAEDLGMTYDELMQRRRGQAFNPEEITAARMLTRSAVQQWWGLLQKVKAGQATDVDKADFARATAVTEASLLQTIGASAEAARTLNAHKLRVGPSTVQMQQMREFIKGFGGLEGDALTQFAARAGDIDSMEGVSKFLLGWRPQAAKGGEGPVTARQRVLNFWVNGLLSGGTLVHKAASDAVMALMPFPRDIGAAAWGTLSDLGRASLGKAPLQNRVYWHEIGSHAFGMLEGVADGLKLADKFDMKGPRAKEFFGLETTPVAQSEMDPKLAAARNYSWLDKAIATPSTGLKNVTLFAQAVNFRASLRSQAARLASQAGLSGRPFADRVADLVQHPSDEMLQTAYDEALRNSLMEPLGEIGRHLQGISNANLFTKFLLPFVKVPINVKKADFRTMPVVGLALKDVRESINMGGAAAHQAVSQMAFGAAVMAWAAWQSHRGRLTGNGPMSPGLKSTWRLQNQPNSWRTDSGQWIDLSPLNPVSDLMSTAADFQQLIEHMPEETANDIATGLAVATLHQLTNAPTLEAWSNIVKASEEPSGLSLTKFIQNSAGSVVPQGVARLARYEDPVLREVNSNLDAIKARVPGWSKDLPPYVGKWGQAVPYHMTPLDIFSPFTHEPVPTDKTSAEAIRLQLELRQLGRKDLVQGIELTPWERNAYNTDLGVIAKGMMDKYVNNPVYPHIPDARKKADLDALWNTARGMAEARALRRLRADNAARVQAGMEQEALKPISPTIKMRP